MEVDQIKESSTVVSGSASVSVHLHPLVLLNISEHWTRNKVKENSDHVVVHGALLGKQEGHHVEISNSFELLLDETNMSLEREFYTTRESQCKQVYPELDIIGWYTTGGQISEADEQFHRQMQESLLILKLDPQENCGEQLPVRVYESVVDNDGKTHFRQVTYALATDETERIGVDYVAGISLTRSDQAASMTAENLLGNYHALKMLSNRLHLIQAYLSAVANNELPVNRACLREISALTKRLPLLSTYTTSADVAVLHSTDENLYRQANDVCLSSLMASITQGLHTLYGCMTKTAHVVDRRSMGASSGMFPSSGFTKMSHFFVNNI